MQLEFTWLALFHVGAVPHFLYMAIKDMRQRTRESIVDHR